ncbi:MAG TPA: hypothetical protein VE871_14580 [Longimicrobium sp.]|nr:hypothetical protein [Longimicrobium sp.]
MTTYDVVPHEGVGPVRLGMTRAESRAAMGLPVQSHGTGRDARDLYLDSAFQVFFDDADRVEYIELSHGGPFIARYESVDVFATDAEPLVELVRQRAAYDENDPELGYSYIFPALQLSVWRSVVPDDDDDEGRRFMTIGVGKPGYFG